MKDRERKLSTRLIRKGSLVEETYAAFRNWDLTVPLRQNISNLREQNPIGATNAKWLHEILTTLSSRFESNETIDPLVVLAQRGLPIDQWKACLLWHIGGIDYLYYEFATHWLYQQYRQGAYVIQTEDVLPYVKQITNGRIASGGSLSEYGAKRAARDLLRMAADFDLLSGRAKKTFTSYHIPEAAFLYVLHGFVDAGMGVQKILASKDWHLFLMDHGDVERELLRLHQYQILEFHVAGSIAQLTLPHASLNELAREFQHD